MEEPLFYWRKEWIFMSTLPPIIYLVLMAIFSGVGLSHVADFEPFSKEEEIQTIRVFLIISFFVVFVTLYFLFMNIDNLLLQLLVSIGGIVLGIVVIVIGGLTLYFFNTTTTSWNNVNSLDRIYMEYENNCCYVNHDINKNVQYIFDDCPKINHTLQELLVDKSSCVIISNNENNQTCCPVDIYKNDVPLCSNEIYNNSTAIQLTVALEIIIGVHMFIYCIIGFYYIWREHKENGIPVCPCKKRAYYKHDNYDDDADNAMSTLKYQMV